MAAPLHWTEMAPALARPGPVGPVVVAALALVGAAVVGCEGVSAAGEEGLLEATETAEVAEIAAGAAVISATLLAVEWADAGFSVEDVGGEKVVLAAGKHNVSLSVPTTQTQLKCTHTPHIELHLDRLVQAFLGRRL